MTKMIIFWDRGMLFHSDCERQRQGIMKEIEHDDKRGLIECLACGKRGYYPVGGAGKICVEEVTEDKADEKR